MKYVEYDKRAEGWRQEAQGRWIAFVHGGLGVLTVNGVRSVLGVDFHDPGIARVYTSLARLRAAQEKRYRSRRKQWIEHYASVVGDSHEA